MTPELFFADAVKKAKAEEIHRLESIVQEVSVHQRERERE
jgi:hypothetical protein